MRRHTEHIAERREIRAAIHKRQQRMRRENSLVDKDLAEVAEGASMEKALTKALAAKEALLRAIKDKSDEIHARAMHARTTESQSQQQLRRTTQKRLTDQMRSDEMSLRKLQDSQQSGVLEQTRAVRRRARRAEALTLSRLRHKRLSLQHKLLTRDHFQAQIQAWCSGCCGFSRDLTALMPSSIGVRAVLYGKCAARCAERHGHHQR